MKKVIEIRLFLGHFCRSFPPHSIIYISRVRLLLIALFCYPGLLRNYKISRPITEIIRPTNYAIWSSRMPGWRVLRAVFPSFMSGGRKFQLTGWEDHPLEKKPKISLTGVIKYVGYASLLYFLVQSYYPAPVVSASSDSRVSRFGPMDFERHYDNQLYGAHNDWAEPDLYPEGVPVSVVVPSGPVVVPFGGVSVGSVSPGSVSDTLVSGLDFTSLDYFTLSFYDPLIGVAYPEIAFVNCFEWDDVNKDCRSMMHSGLDFRSYYAGRSVADFSAVACRYELFLARAEFEVLSPSWLADLAPYVKCLDTGDAIVGRWMDFLIDYRDLPMPYSEFPWSDLVVVRRIK